MAASNRRAEICRVISRRGVIGRLQVPHWVPEPWRGEYIDLVLEYGEVGAAERMRDTLKEV